MMVAASQYFLCKVFSNNGGLCSLFNSNSTLIKEISGNFDKKFNGKLAVALIFRGL